MVEYIILGVLLVFLIFIFTRFRLAATGKIKDNLYAVRCLFVNFYVLETNEGIVLFDTGVNAAAAKRGLNKFGIPPESVTHVFLTHTDYDHAGGLAAFPKAELYISKAEEQMINGETARRMFLRNKRLASFHTMEDNEALEIGSARIQLLLCPGHTPGSSAYFVDGRFFICGDLLRLSRRGALLPFLRLMNMNHRQDIQSVEAMRDAIKKAEYILTGHTGIKRGYEDSYA